MKAEGSPHPLPEYRIRARRLLKQLRSDSEEAAVAAAVRFGRLRSFSDRTFVQILEDCDRVRLKHALAVIALEHGYESWRALKATAEAGGHSTGSSPAWGRKMYTPKMDVFLNRWFARYEEAHASLREQGGFLLPYERQFFVCGEGAIRVLGLEPGDPDWDRIGRDWAKPLDPEAWQRLRRKREQALFGEMPPMQGAGV